MTDEFLMQEAIAEARGALAMDEVPVGCVILHLPTDRIIGRGHNRRETDGDPTAHAEMIALREASAALGHWRLSECAAAVTLEPCPMCAGAIVNARVARVIYGCDDPKAGAIRTLYQICDDPRLNHRAQITGGVMAEECAKLLSEFFKERRACGKK
jgi:tRNA(adenine34) deaminase